MATAGNRGKRPTTYNSKAQDMMAHIMELLSDKERQALRSLVISKMKPQERERYLQVMRRKHNGPGNNTVHPIQTP